MTNITIASVLLAIGIPMMIYALGYCYTQKRVSSKPLTKLKKIAAEYASQSNRATAKPYLYLLKDKQVQIVPEDYHTHEGWVDEEQDDIGDREALVDHLYEYEAISQEEKERLEELDRWDFESYMTDHLPDYSKQYWIEIDVVKGYFFTEKALNEHLEDNKHHYYKPFSYVVHCFRNPEMETVVELLDELAK